MKKIITTFCALLLVVAFKASAQKEQTRQVSGDFNLITNDGSFTVHVKIDGTQSIRVVSERGEYDKIETVISNGSLRIGTKRGLGWRDGVHGNVEVYVTAKAISNVHNNGSGDVEINGDMQGGRVMLYNNGSGTIKIKGNLVGDNVFMNADGSGDIDINGAATGKEVSIHVNGSGNVTTGVKTVSVDTHLSGSGNINLSGSAEKAMIIIDSSGQINGRNLRAGDVSVHNTGSGNVRIGADKTISVYLTGSGNVVYNGSGNMTQIHSTGSGSVHKGNE